jgi:hypothetical protein
MASVSHSLSLGIPAIAGARHDDVVDAGYGRAAQASSAWRFVSFSVATGSHREDGCWLKLDGSPDWYRIENDSKLQNLLVSLLDERGFGAPDVHPHLASNKVRSSIWLYAKIVFLALLLSGAAVAASYRDAVTKYAQEFLAVTPATPQFSSDIEDGLAKAVMDIRRSLPKQIDPMTTLMWVTYSGTTMIYDNRLEIDGTKIDDGIKKKLAQLITVNTCGSPASRKLLDFGGSYRYVYSDNHAKVVMSIDIDKTRCS